MSNLSTVTDNMLPVASETFVDNLAAGIGAGADIVPLLSLAEYNDGDSVVLTVDPGTSDQATFIGKVDGNEVIDVEWTEGNLGASHAAGATVIDYDSSTHYNVLTKLLRMIANQDGTLKTTSVQAALNIQTTNPDWTPLANVPSLASTKGMGVSEITFTGINYTDRISKGARIKIPRGTPAQAKSAKLNGTSQYWDKPSPLGLTFTDDFSVGAWIYVESLGGNQQIISRWNGTNGWYLFIDSTGKLILNGVNNGVNNYNRVLTRDALPLKRWVHVAAQLDMSAYSISDTTSYILVDGVRVPCSVFRSGTNPTALVQAGNLQIGASNGSSYFNGSIAQAWISPTKTTIENVRNLMNQELNDTIITENNIVSAYSFNDSANDLNTTNPNNLSPMNGVTSDNLSSPFSKEAFGVVIRDPVFADGDTTVTIQTHPAYAVPNSPLAAASISGMQSPYGYISPLNDVTAFSTASASMTFIAPYDCTIDVEVTRNSAWGYAGASHTLRVSDIPGLVTAGSLSGAISGGDTVGRQMTARKVFEGAKVNESYVVSHSLDGNPGGAGIVDTLVVCYPVGAIR